MGIVIRQSLFSSVFGYAGTVIGYVNVVILMPLFMDLDEIGLFRTIISITMLLAPFSILGATAALQRFFPIYEKRRERLLIQIFGLALLGFILISGLLFLFKTQFFSFFAGNANQVNDYFYLIPLFLGFVVLFNIFEAFSKANMNITVPNFLRDVVYKSFTLLSILAYGFGYISFSTFMYFQAGIYFVLGIALFIHISKRFGFLGEIRKISAVSFDSSLVTFSLFSLLSGAGITIVMQIDQIMVSKYLGLTLNGVYSTALFMAVVIEFPKRFVSQISYQILTNLYAENNISTIEKHYKSASINQLILGGFLFLMLTINMESIYALMPNGEKFSAGLLVIYIIGATKLMTMMFSLGSEIISVSDFYRYNVILVVSLGIITIVSNLLLIPEYGIYGAATATFLSFLFYDIAKFLLIRHKLKIQPFSTKTMGSFLLIIVGFGLHFLIPTFTSVFVDIAIRSALVGGIYLVSVYFLRISEEVNTILEGIFKRIVSNKESLDK